uniref:Hepatocyte growth factor-regulated tyrosine kinase substrate n=1 Tax=Biomphalaria glabrata TaxID=6526 RepID=A0A2C9JRS2_BIOGL
MFGGGSSNFTKNLEKATSQLLLEPDWNAVLQIVDSIRQEDVQAKLALQAIRKKIGNENPHVSMFALQVLEACVKNCGSSFHNEVATKEFMEYLKDLVKARQVSIRNDPVKEKILELIQCWSHAFRNDPHYKVVEDTFHLLKMEGNKFPALKEADAMFDAEKAPTWKDGETCTRCRVQFTLMQRKHHCRNCGEVFCGKCSAKSSLIPKLGFEREVRVCDSCYEKINKKQKGKKSKRSGPAKKDDDLPAEYLASPLSKQPQIPASKTEQEQQEEEELQLALALSKSEHETKEKERERLRSNYGVYGGKTNSERPISPAKTVTVAPAPLDTSDMDPELARYLNRHFWQQKSETQGTQQQQTATTVPSAPSVNSEPRMSTGQINESPPVVSSHLYQNGDTEDSQEQFLSALQGSLEIFVNRMRSNSQRGRPIANDSAVQSLFAVISEMHPQLMTHIQEKEEDRAYYEGLQDKLTQLRDAREALDSLREEHREKKRRQAEEMERLRQIQMMQKLEVMRQKKHEYLEMQRQLALQRLQEQEREMAARFEQQKHLTHIRQMQTFGYPQAYPQTMIGQPGLPPNGAMASHGYTSGGGSTEGSPVHRVGAPPESYMQQPHGPQGMSLPPHLTQGEQPGMYHMGAQYGAMGPSSMPPTGYQTEAMLGPQGYAIQGEQGPMSMAAQHSTVGPMSAPNMGNYSGVYGQMPTAVHHPNPSLGGIEGAASYAGAPTPQEFQSFNMPGLAAALPSHPNAPMFNNPNQPIQQQYVTPGQPQQFQQPTQQPYAVPYQQQGGPTAGQASAGQRELQLISFDD